MLWTGYSPYKYEDLSRVILARKGIPPQISRTQRRREEYVDRTMKQVFTMCMKGEPQEHRASAREMAEFLKQALHIVAG